MEVTPKSDDTDLRLWRKKVINKSSVENPPPKVYLMTNQKREREKEKQTEDGEEEKKGRKEGGREEKEEKEGGGEKYTSGMQVKARSPILTPSAKVATILKLSVCDFHA